MIYLKFVGYAGLNNDTLNERVYACKKYDVTRIDGGARVYYDDGMWESLSMKEGWMSCFVMSETGKTIDSLHAENYTCMDPIDSDVAGSVITGEFLKHVISNVDFQEVTEKNPVVISNGMLCGTYGMNEKDGVTIILSKSCLESAKK